jgi:hypothetical protein
VRLWRQPDFVKFWAGQTISLLGSQVTSLALAWTAAVVLQAAPAEMGLISSLNVLPFVLFGLRAGCEQCNDVTQVLSHRRNCTGDLVKELLVSLSFAEWDGLPVPCSWPPTSEVFAAQLDHEEL